MSGPVDRPDLADPATRAEYLARIAAMRPDAQPLWGSMTAGQALEHCAEVLAVANGKELAGTPLLVRLLGPLIKRVVVGPKPYPRNTRTHPQYMIIDDVDFAAARARLTEEIERFGARGEEPVRHPVFGRMSPGEAGRAMAKHLDHHLAQFGA